MTPILAPPYFFNYIEENADNGYETIQDFYLSWFIRWGDKKNKELNPVLHEFGRKTIFLLLYGENVDGQDYVLKKQIDENFAVTNVTTKRQKNQIDLVAEFELVNDDKKYVFNIENKWYTNVRNGQLAKSRTKINTLYSEASTVIINMVIFCDNQIIIKSPSIKEHCKENGYKCLSLDDISKFNHLHSSGKSGNHIFDEFWFNFPTRGNPNP